MAILYGTTADGESLPVQVNEFGQLVAKGLPGEKGDQGEQGEEGPVGNVDFTQGSFAPTFESSTGEGEGLLDYSKQVGYWYRFGPLLTVQCFVRTSDVLLTAIRGELEVGGLPEEARFATPSSAATYGPFSLNYLSFAGLGVFQSGRVMWEASRSTFKFKGLWNGEWLTPMYADLQTESSGWNMAAFTFSGLAQDAVRSVPVDLDELV